MGVVVTFDLGGWRTLYPEFAEVADAQVQAYVSLATLLHRNDGGGPVDDPATQQTLLWLVTAHLTALNAPNPDGTAKSSVVGRVSDATQGSVSVSTEYGTITPTMAFWLQTKYGALYWAATASFRTMRYLPRRRFFDPIMRRF